MSPLSSRALRGQAPRRRYAAADTDSQAPAQAVVQGQPGIEPGRTLAVAAGLLACASKHNGLLHVSVASRSLCSLCVHTAAAVALRPSGARNPRYVLRPAAPARGISAAHAAPNTKACVGHGFAIATGDHSQALRAVLMVGPARPPSAPKGLPSVRPPPRELPPLPRQASTVLAVSRVRCAALRAPLTRLRSALWGLGQRRSP